MRVSAARQLSTFFVDNYPYPRSPIQLVEDAGRQAGSLSFVLASAPDGEGLGRMAVMTQRLQVGEVVEAASVGDLPDVVHLGGWSAAPYAPVLVSVEGCLSGLVPGCWVELSGVG